MINFIKKAAGVIIMAPVFIGVVSLIYLVLVFPIVWMIDQADSDLEVIIGVACGVLFWVVVNEACKWVMNKIRKWRNRR